MKLSKVAVFVGLACTTVVQAEEVFTFDEVVVSATRNEQAVRDIAASVSTITSEDIAKSMSSDLQQALKSEPGVSMEGQGRFGLTGFNIRGREENYVKVLVDGVQQASIYNPGADVMRKNQGMFELDTLTSLEVNKGPVSSLYGSDALAGVVVMRTKNPSDLLAEEGDDTYAAFSGGYTSVNDSFKSTVTIANRTGDWESLVMYTKRDGHETQTHSSGADIEGRDRGQADPFDITQDNFLAKLFYQVNDAHRIGFTAEVFNRTAEGDLLHNEGYEIVMPPEWPKYLYTQNSADDKDQRQRFSFEHQWQVDGRYADDLEWLLAWQRSETMHNNYDHTEAHGYRNRERNGVDESTQFDITLNKGIDAGRIFHELTYGASYFTNQFELDYTNHFLSDGEVVDANPEVPDAKSNQWGVFIQDQMFLMDDRLVLTFGGRYDSFEATPNNGSSYDKASNDAFTGRIGTVYHWTEQFSTFAQVSQGFKAPTIQDLYYEYSMGAILEPNTDLKAEESIAYEVGTRWAHRFGHVEASVFYNDYKNFIEDKQLEDNDEGLEVWTKDNVAKARIYGAELSSQTDLHRLVTAPKGSYLDFSIAYADGKDKESGDAIDSVAPLTSYIALGYDAPQGHWGSQVSVEAVAGKSGDDWSDSENLKAPGYAVTDLTAYYKPSSAMTLRAGLFNAFDKKYWHYADLENQDADSQGIDRRTQPGRNWGVEFDYEF